MPFIHIDRDAAHQAAQDELNKPIYSKGSAGQQLNEWINEMLYRLIQQTASIPGGWFTAMVLLILLAIAVAVAVQKPRQPRNRLGQFVTPRQKDHAKVVGLSPVEARTLHQQHLFGLQKLRMNSWSSWIG